MFKSMRRIGILCFWNIEFFYHILGEIDSFMFFQSDHLKSEERYFNFDEV